MKEISTLEYIKESFSGKNLEICLILNAVYINNENISYKELMDKTKLGYYNLIKKLDKINKVISKYKGILQNKW